MLAQVGGLVAAQVVGHVPGDRIAGWTAFSAVVLGLVALRHVLVLNRGFALRPGEYLLTGAGRLTAFAPAVVEVSRASGSGGGATIASILVVGGATTVFTALSLRGEEAQRLGFGSVSPRTPGHARRVAGRCRHLLGRTTNPKTRPWLRLNLADALTMQSVGADEPRGLLYEALDLLTGLIEEHPGAAPSAVAAVKIAEAADRLERVDGDLDVLDAALRRLEELGNAHPEVPQFGFALAGARSSRTHAHLWQVLDQVEVGRASRQEAVRAWEQAVADCRRARDLAPATRRAEFAIDLASVRSLGVQLDLADGQDRGAVVTAAKEDLRAAIDALPRHAAELMAATLPMLVAVVCWEASETGRADPDELRSVERRIRRSLRRTRDPAFRGALLNTLATVTALRSTVTGADSLVTTVLDLYRRAAETASGGAEVRYALEWADAAAAHDLADQAAEGYTRALRQARMVSTTGLTRDQRAFPLRRVRRAAAEAAYWLADSGRLADAVVALETGRAITLTDAVERRRLPDLLRARDHPDLAEAAGELAAELAAEPVFRPKGAQSVPVRRRLFSAQRRWLALVDRIRGVPGLEGFLLPPGYPELVTGLPHPVVYVTAAERGGLALVVEPDGDAPRLVRLPELTSADVDKAVAVFRRSREIGGAPGDSRLRRALGLMGDMLTELHAELGEHGKVTLIPLGGLGLFPLHLLDPENIPAQVSYAPNARVLTGSEGRPRAFIGSSALIADSGPPESGGLRTAEAEVRAIGRYLSGASVFRSPRPGDVLDLLTGHDLCHFACHAEAGRDDPLDGHLNLSHGRLELRDIVTKDLSGLRLVVLSACESGVPHDDLLDESLGFPGMLIEAGAGAVIGSLWKVRDDAATALMVRFYDLWQRRGVPPGKALGQAQRWLRNVTVEQLEIYAAGRFTLHLRHPGHDAGNIRPFRHPADWAAFIYMGREDHLP
ncbi:CHAT domain-containing protein [Actinocorallia longicatena]|uniref:CHAT domain-containing protein n=1 Tax=Actinocorallia longicatena TaxID=111803 RepID=UPI0031DA6CB8